MDEPDRKEIRYERQKEKIRGSDRQVFILSFTGSAGIQGLAVDLQPKFNLTWEVALPGHVSNATDAPINRRTLKD